MIFTHGFVHCDPHPGNVLINPLNSKAQNNKDKNSDFEIVLIDHGLYTVTRLLIRVKISNNQYR
jgi:aarF domain-containing kinase